MLLVVRSMTTSNPNLSAVREIAIDGKLPATIATLFNTARPTPCECVLSVLHEYRMWSRLELLGQSGTYAPQFLFVRESECSVLGHLNHRAVRVVC